MKRPVLWTLSIAILVSSLGCGTGSGLRARKVEIEKVLEQAREQGAKQCAPKLLARGEAYVDFARQDMEEGNYYYARNQLDTADKNARAALRRSPPGKCAGAPSEVTTTDRDGDGIEDRDDKCPLEAEDIDGFRDEDGCPDTDNDRDNIKDIRDRCPNDPEDEDGFEDKDGCPDNDNDNDGIADEDDNCPLEREDTDGFEDQDGCPDADNDGDGFADYPNAIDKCPNNPGKAPDGCPTKLKLVKVTDSKIELTQTVYFETGKARIKPISFALLDEVAVVMQENPKLRVRIEGHTDSRGRARRNQRLSDDRAASVKTYLMRKGVPSGRMKSQGYGETMPIADNRSRAGREQNRRVEFVIIGK